MLEERKQFRAQRCWGAGCVDLVLYKKARSPGSRTLALLAAQWYPRVSVNKTGNEATEGTVALNC